MSLKRFLRRTESAYRKISWDSRCRMSQTTLSLFLKALYESNEKTQSKSPKGTSRFFPFLPNDNNLSPLSRGSFSRKEESLDQKRNDQKEEESKRNMQDRSSFSIIEAEDYIDCTLESLRSLLVMPYLLFLR